MNIYHVSADTCSEWDYYTDAVVIAENETEAALMHPDGGKSIVGTDGREWPNDQALVRVRLLGRALDGAIKEVVCANYVLS